MRGEPRAASGESADMLAALRAQDPAVARSLWQCFAPTILRILGRTLGPEARIDDAAQVVLLCVFERARRVRPGSDLRQLVVRVTARIAHVELRRRAFSSVFPAARARARRKAAAVDRPRSVPETVVRFYRILDRLSALDRVAFALHYIEGMDVRDVASAIDASSGQTSRRLRRSFAKVVAGIERDPRSVRSPARPND